MNESTHSDPSPLAITRGEHRLTLDFAVDMDHLEGILAVIQEWAGEQEIARDDGLSLRLVLDELLGNLCMHAAAPAQTIRVRLQLQLLETGGLRPDTGSSTGREKGHRAGQQGVVRILLQDTAAPFNPLAYEAPPVTDIRTTPTGGKGLALVRLLTMGIEYQWTGTGNHLILDLPLADNHPPEDGQVSLPARSATVAGTLGERIHALWAGNLALRQTLRFTLYAILLLWGGMAMYLAEIARNRDEGARLLTEEALHTQSEISSAFMQRLGNELQVLARTASTLPQIASLRGDPDALMQALQPHGELRTLTAEIPDIGVVVGQGEQAWLYRAQPAGTARQPLTLTPGAAMTRDATRAQWQSLFMTFQPGDPHAAMLCKVPLPATTGVADPWLGTVITMPWITATLHALSGFRDAAPVLLDASGHYIIYPPGRHLGAGPQSLSDEARTLDAPALRTLEQTILDGQRGVVRLASLPDITDTPWPVPWTGPTSIAYSPMEIPGWYLVLLVSSAELGNPSLPPPFILLLVALLGPAAIGTMTWLITSRTLQPLHRLLAALERFGKGDMDTPFPPPRYPDEIGSMLLTFEQVRITVRTSLHNLVNTSAVQQRIHNELSLARHIQESMLPAAFPTLHGSAVHAEIDMCREVCGDLYDCFIADDESTQRMCCVMGDVCGKGVPAAIIMSRAMSLVRAFQLEGLPPAEILFRLNNALLHSDNSSMFVTMLVGVLEPDGVFVWSSAGHPPPLPGPLPAPGEPDEFAPQPVRMQPWPGELVLGVRADQRYSTFRTPLAPGQSLLLYTDGADEAQGPPAPGTTDNVLYGEERLSRSFDRACRETGLALPCAERPGAIVTGVRADILRHMGNLPLVDDLSLMVVSRAIPGEDCHRDRQEHTGT